MTDWRKIVAKHGPLVWRTVYRLLDHRSERARVLPGDFLGGLAICGASICRRLGLVPRELGDPPGH